jgi:hypothetical protein
LILALISISSVEAAEKPVPPVFDLCQYQTAIKNQGARDSCPYFPPVAALEAAYARQGKKVDLSTEHLIWLRNVTASSDKKDRDTAENLCSTLGGGNGMSILQHYAICRDQDLPYHGGGEVVNMASPYYRGFELGNYDWSRPFPQLALNRWNLDPRQLPPAARENARYAIAAYITLPEQDLRNPQKFEEILASGHEIVFAVNLHANSDDSATGQPVWRLKPNQGGSSINHFMLMVGYDRNRRFFVVKNQWGPTRYSKGAVKLAKGWEDVGKYDGYTLVDYNYLGACAEAHYIRSVVPPEENRFRWQRVLGQWRVRFTHDGEPVLSGVLCWRHWPVVTGSHTDLRIGDLVTDDGRQYRVNAKFQDRGTRYPFTMYVDFATGTLPLDSKHGTAWTGELSLPEPKGGTLHAECVAKRETFPRKVGAGKLAAEAVLVEDRNLLADLIRH